VSLKAKIYLDLFSVSLYHIKPQLYSLQQTDNKRELIFNFNNPNNLVEKLA